MPRLSAIHALYAAALISGLGTAALLIVLPWELQRLSGSTAMTASYFVCGNLLLLLAMPAVSVWIDRSDRVKANITTCLGGAFVQLAVSAILLVRHDALWPLVASAIAAVALRSVDQVARNTLAQEISEPDELRKVATRLELARNIVTLLSGLAGAAMLVAGARFGGVLVTVTSALSGLMSALLLSTAGRQAGRQHSRRPGRSAAASRLDDLAAALRTLSRQPQLAIPAMITCACQAMIMAQATLYPAHFKPLAQDAALAYAMHAVAYGAGALAGPFVATARFAAAALPLTRIALSLTVFACATLMLATLHSIGFSFACIGVLALANSVMRIDRGTLLFTGFPTSMQARIGGMFEFSITLIGIVAAFCSAQLADRYGVTAVWSIYSVCLGLLLLLTLRARAISMRAATRPTLPLSQESHEPHSNR